MCKATSSQTTGHAQEPRIAPSASRSTSGALKDRVKLTLNTDKHLINSVQLLFSVCLVEYVNINISVTHTLNSESSLNIATTSRPTHNHSSICSTWSTDTEIKLTFSCESDCAALQLPQASFLQLTALQQQWAGSMQTSPSRDGLQMLWCTGYISWRWLSPKPHCASSPMLEDCLKLRDAT